MPGSVKRFDWSYADECPENVFGPGYTHAHDECYRCVAPYNVEKFKRLVRDTDNHEILIYIDGACPNNGRESAQSGSGVVYRKDVVWQGGKDIVKYAGLSFAVEQFGLDGDRYKPTSNRAELRAALAALQCLDWENENVRSLVLATDSTYVVSGCTDWVRKWERNGWRLSNGLPVKNKDLWEAMSNEMESINDDGVDIKFWQIPRAWNVADALAKEGALKQQARCFRKRFGNASR
ncbi:hypothetical protein SBRCBS47491_007278 [Sporothrix bragantina]|uniref:ribonuclease H n=1 Tax=Sporothrix bragantina TaxID=671064 RepID=A0ABP0CD10_9PEZI